MSKQKKKFFIYLFIYLFIFNRRRNGSLYTRSFCSLNVRLTKKEWLDTTSPQLQITASDDSNIPGIRRRKHPKETYMTVHSLFLFSGRCSRERTGTERKARTFARSPPPTPSCSALASREAVNSLKETTRQR